MADTCCADGNIPSITREIPRIFRGFEELAQRLAPELALLPIGAYNPPSFRNVHTNPADAMRAFLDLNARVDGSDALRNFSSFA